MDCIDLNPYFTYNLKCGCVCEVTSVAFNPCDLMDYSPPGSSIHGILQTKYWNGFPCLPPGDLPDPGIKPTSLMSPALAGMFFTSRTTWEAHDLK